MTADEQAARCEPRIVYTWLDDGIHMECPTCGFSKALGFDPVTSDVVAGLEDHDGALTISRR